MATDIRLDKEGLPITDEDQYDGAPDEEQEGDEDVYSGDLERYYFQIKLEGDPMPKRYYLEEMSGATRDQFLESQKNVVNYRTKEIRVYKEIQTRLLAFCMHDADTEKLIDRKEINKLGSKTMGKLYNKAVELSALTEGAEEEAKND